MYKNTLLNALWAVFLLLLINGCSSSYKGYKLSPDGNLEGIETGWQGCCPKGIPYQLMRQEFELNQIPPATGAKTTSFELIVSYHPDPNHRYLLNIDPAIFTDTEFEANIGPDGNLTSTTSKTLEQFTPTVAALGSFTANIVGTLAKAAAFDVAPAHQTIIDELNDLIRPICAQNPKISWPCIKDPNNKWIEATQKKFDKAKKINKGNKASCKSDKKVLHPCFYDLDQMKWRKAESQDMKVMELLVKRLEVYGKSEEKFLASFHYLNTTEKNWLYSIFASIDKPQKAIIKKAEDAWMKSKKNFDSNNPSEEAKKISKSVTELVDKGDWEGLTDYSNKLNKMNFNDKQLNKYIKNLTKNASADLKNFTTDGITYSKRKDRSRVYKMLKGFIEMSPEVWRARHLLYLDKKIQQMEVSLIQAGKSPDFQELKDLRIERAKTLGVLFDYLRSQKLRKFLKNITMKSINHSGGTAPATTEYATARTELEKVEVRIQGARGRVLQAIVPKPKPIIPAPANQKFKILNDMTLVENSKKAGWFGSPEEKISPDFIIVREHLVNPGE